MDKFIEVEGYEYSREGYYYRATNGHSWYYIFLTIDENHVIVEVRDESQLSNENDSYGTLENGDKHVYCSGGDLVFSIDIWAKYFFPEFNEENNQWYHAMDGPYKKDVGNSLGCMNDTFEVFKFAYELALKEGNIKPY